MKVRQSAQNKNDYRSDIYDAKVRIAVTRWELGKAKGTKLKNDECDSECEGA